jgi:ubiquinone/menaquinone biosynthesis C-methylase UbiE
MQRVLRPGGTTILLETLGTGQETLHPPTPELAALYDLLQIKYGFNQTRIRTD